MELDYFGIQIKKGGLVGLTNSNFLGLWELLIQNVIEKKDYSSKALEIN